MTMDYRGFTLVSLAIMLALPVPLQAQGYAAGGSDDAVNGSQLHAALRFIANLRTSLATLVGGGLVIGADGMVQTAPAITVAGNACSNLTDAVMASC